MWNRSNFENKFFNFASNGKGVACPAGNVVFYSSPDNWDNRACVATCPSGYFASQGLCLPTNDDLRAKYLANSSASSPFDYDNFKWALLWSALTALGIGLLWLFISLCFPKLAPIIAHVLGALALITLGILVLVLWDNWLTCLFDLVRTDAYSYMNLSGIPFCNSARQVKKINERNPTYIGSHSPLDHYRFAATVFVTVASIIACWFILRARVWNISLWHWIVLIVVIYAIVNWFVNIVADAAEGLQTSFLAERELENGNFKYMQRLLPSFRSPLEHIERRLHGEGDGYL